NDVRMLETREQLRLAPETILGNAVHRVGRQHLHDDGSVERALRGQEQAAHSAGRKLALDAITVAEGAFEARPESPVVGVGSVHGCVDQSVLVGGGDWCRSGYGRRSSMNRTIAPSQPGGNNE